MKRLAGLVLMALASTVLAAGTAMAREVDDSYTIAQRFEQYQGRYPGIALPVAPFAQGQTVLFDRTYKKTSDRTLALDIFLPPPEQATGSAILLVHGGAWRSGNKSHFYALATLLAQRGHVVFLPEFRLAGEAPYPAGMVDIADALGWVHDHAAEFGIAADRIAVGGASSGGQMAALLAYGGHSGLFGNGGRKAVAALIDLDGVLDFTTPLALRFENAAAASSPAAQWLGGSYEEQPQQWAAASAASHAGPHSPPTLILGSGIARFTAGREKVLAMLSQNGIAGEAHDLADAPHDFWLFDPWLSPTAARIDTFLAGLHAAKKRDSR